MKTITTIMIALLIAVGASAQKSKSETIVIRTKIYCDHCLQCGSCGENITAHIEKVDGTKKVVIDPKTNTISVTFNPQKTNADAIRAAVNDAGFDADNKKAPEEAVKKLDACCLKKE